MMTVERAVVRLRNLRKDLHYSHVWTRGKHKGKVMDRSAKADIEALDMAIGILEQPGVAELAAGAKEV